MANVNIRPFLGEWKLIPEQSRYEMGHPPKKAFYRIQPKNEQFSFTAEWTTEDDNRFQVTYYSVPDGKSYPYGNPRLADTISSRLLDGRTLDTAVSKDNIVISYARRTLSDDHGVMTVTQTGFTPDGKPYSNLSVYRKCSLE
ncbi:hypothetical protein AB6A23_17090 [Paenibacillus tarimensis]